MDFHLPSNMLYTNQIDPSLVVTRGTRLACCLWTELEPFVTKHNQIIIGVFYIDAGRFCYQIQNSEELTEYNKSMARPRHAHLAFYTVKSLLHVRPVNKPSVPREKKLPEAVYASHQLLAASLL